MTSNSTKKAAPTTATASNSNEGKCTTCTCAGQATTLDTKSIWQIHFGLLVAALEVGNLIVTESRKFDDDWLDDDDILEIASMLADKMAAYKQGGQ